MADIKSHSPGHATHPHVTHGTDMGAAFLGLIIGVVALFLLIGSIVMLTNRHYAREKSAASAER